MLEVLHLCPEADVLVPVIPDGCLVLNGQALEGAHSELQAVFRDARESSQVPFALRPSGLCCRPLYVPQLVDGRLVLILERLDHLDDLELPVDEALQLQQCLLLQSAATELVGSLRVTKDQALVALRDRKSVV